MRIARTVLTVGIMIGFLAAVTLATQAVLPDLFGPINQAFEDINRAFSSNESDLENTTCACLAPVFGLIATIAILLGVVALVIHYAVRTFEGENQDGNDNREQDDGS